MTVAYSPSPLIGGFSGNVNLLANIFDLRQFHIPPSKLIDGLDRAIGDYEREEQRLYRRIFNPFFWIGWLFLKILRLPFQILGAAGFDSQKMENSIGGRTIKAISGFVIFVSTILAGIEALHSLGWFDSFKKLVHSGFRHY